MDSRKLYFAVLTPFNSGGQIDFGAFKEYLLFLMEHGVKNIITNGTTGEFASLTIAERNEILEFCRKNFRGSIINNISACCIKDSLTLLEHSKGLADSVLVLPPYYYANVTDSGVELFFEEILKNSPMPVYLYNIPKHTKISIKPDSVSRLLSGYGNLEGIKDSSGSPESFMAFNEVSKEFKVYPGSDSLIYDCLRWGLAGSVSGSGNPVPEYPVRIFNSFMEGDLELAEKLQNSYNTWNSFRKKSGFGEIPLVKALMGSRINGFPVNTRPPFVNIDPATVNILREKFNEMMAGFIT